MDAPFCIGDYLRACGQALGERVLNQFPSLHAATVPASSALCRLKRRPFPAQTLAIMGIAKRWQQARCAAAVDQPDVPLPTSACLDRLDDRDADKRDFCADLE